MSALAGAAVLLVTILLAAFFWARARRRARPEPFSLAAPSPPLVREAVAALAGSVHTFRTSAAAARGGPGCTAACAAKLAQVEAALAPADELFRLPPTLANHLATYRGLQDAPADLEALADGLRAEDAAQRGAPNRAAPPPCTPPLRAARCLEEVARNVHRLGAALDLE